MSEHHTCSAFPLFLPFDSRALSDASVQLGEWTDRGEVYQSDRPIRHDTSAGTRSLLRRGACARMGNASVQAVRHGEEGVGGTEQASWGAMQQPGDHRVGLG